MDKAGAPELRHRIMAGFIGNVVVGIFGSFVGYWLLGKLGVNLGTGLVGALLTGAIGAIVILFLLNLIFKKKK